MATSTLRLLLLLLAFLVAAATARPCKTIFYFSATTTTTYYPSDSLDRNPNGPSYLQIRSPRFMTLIFTTTTTTTDAPRFSNRRPHANFDRLSENPQIQSSSSGFPLKFHPSVSSSVRDRTMDILSVVGALLFGVGSGVITAAVMYSLWALFNSRGVDFDDVSDDEGDDDLKKHGYVALPAKMVDDDLKMPAPPAKEVV